MTNPVLDKVVAAADDIAAEGEVNERLGKLSNNAARLLRDTGVIRMLQPAKHGGLEAHPAQFAETVMKTAAQDGATGWVAGVVGLHPYEMAMADPRVHEKGGGADRA